MGKSKLKPNNTRDVSPQLNTRDVSPQLNYDGFDLKSIIDRAPEGVKDVKAGSELLQAWLHG